VSELESLLDDLTARRIELWEENGNLKYRAPQNVLTPDLRRRMVEHRAALVGWLSRCSSGSGGAPAIATERLPMTELQRAYWLAEQESDDATAGYWFNEYAVDDLDVERLRTAWQRLAERHDFLRVVIGPDGQQELRVRTPPYPIDYEDLRSLGPDALEEHLARTRGRWRTPRRSMTDWPLIDVLVQRTGEDLRVYVAGRFVILDWMAYDQFCEELALVYADLRAPLPPLQQSYRGAAVEQIEAERSPESREALAWWLRRDLPDPPDLPLRRQFDPNARRWFERHTGKLAAADAAALQGRCARAKITLNTALMAAYADVLASRASERHFLLNLLLSRPRRHIRGGGRWPLSNAAWTVMLEVDFRADDDFATRTARLQRRLAEDLGKAGGVSGSTVTRERARRLGRPPLPNPYVFASVVGMDTDGEGRYGLERLGWRPLYNYIQTPHVLLDQQVFGRAGGLVFNWDYARDAFEPGFVTAMFDEYRDLLHRLATDDRAWRARPVSRLPPAQRQSRARANTTAVAFAPGCLHDFLADRRTERALAVVDGDVRWTYSELVARAAGVAAQLDRLPGGRPVPVLARTGSLQIAGALGAAMAGAPFVPLDPQMPALRLEQLLKQLGSPVVLTDRASAERRLGAAEWLVIDDAGSAPSDAVTRDPAAIAYVIFTSGSTGVPKGVVIEHRAARNTIDDMLRRWPLGRQDAVLAVSQCSFDLSIYDRFALFTAGGKVVFPEPERRSDPEHWCQVMDRERVTVWNSVPALAEMLVDYAEAHTVRLPLRLALLSGDWIPRTLPRRLRGVAPGCQIIALGGATEASIWSNFYDTRELDESWPSIPYGAPLANQTLHVLDAHLHDRPDLCEGDLYIGGAGLAREYWGDAEKTHAAFIVHPRSGERLYRTGDRARYWPDGTMEFLGRRDAQVKVRGHRIELGEIEAALERFPGIRSAAALTVGDGNAARLAAAVVGEVDVASREDELRAFLRQRLPEHMVPRRIVGVSSLLLTPNGKVDRHALRPLLAGRPELEGPADGDRPADAVEVQVFDAWARVIGHRDFGRRSNFFEIGGDSVAIVRLVNALEVAGLGPRLSIAAAMNTPTVREMAALLRASAPSAASAGDIVQPLTACQTGPLVCCVHPIGGTVFAYRLLAQRLGGEYEVFGVSAAALFSEAADRSVEEMAARYLRAARARSRWADRLVLVGWSFGGVVALEMKRRLMAEGLDVPAVVIDPWVPESPGTVPTQQEVRAEFAANLSQNGPRVQPPPGGWESPPADSPELARIYHVYQANTNALFTHRPPLEPEVECTVVVAGRLPARPFLRLRRLLDSPDWRLRAQVVEVAADHYDIMQAPAMDRVAAAVRAAAGGRA
jgi:amino acid adenylation domain-containing protein